jgi:prepilin-type N-terminal cleavage/methylation domain-containing protein
MNRLFQEIKGFSLVELSIVLVIIGLILGASVTVWRSSIGATRLSTTKTNLENIKNSVINFAIANGRLPCPDTWVAPPNNTGQSNPLVAGVCVFGAGCPVPPCYVPFQTLQLQLPGGKDSFGNVFRYDISYSAAAGSGLTNTTQDTFCAVLFEYMSHANDIGAQTVVPCVTNSTPGNDATNDGPIDAAGQGYGVATVIISQSSVDNVFNAPPGLGGKNVIGADREYEMASRTNDNTYGDFVAELTYGDLYNKVCTMQKTKIKIVNNTPALVYAKIPGTGCMLIAIGQSVDLYQGSTVTFWTTADCATTQCGASTVTFNMSAVANDAGNVDWSGLPFPVVPRNGRVQITTGACTLGDI